MPRMKMSFVGGCVVAVLLGTAHWIAGQPAEKPDQPAHLSDFQLRREMHDVIENNKQKWESAEKRLVNLESTLQSELQKNAELRKQFDELQKLSHVAIERAGRPWGQPVARQLNLGVAKTHRSFMVLSSWSIDKDQVFTALHLVQVSQDGQKVVGAKELSGGVIGGGSFQFEVKENKLQLTDYPVGEFTVISFHTP